MPANLRHDTIRKELKSFKMALRNAIYWHAEMVKSARKKDSLWMLDTNEDEAFIKWSRKCGTWERRRYAPLSWLDKMKDSNRSVLETLCKENLRPGDKLPSTLRGRLEHTRGLEFKNLDLSSLKKFVQESGVLAMLSPELVTSLGKWWTEKTVMARLVGMALDVDIYLLRDYKRHYLAESMDIKKLKEICEERTGFAAPRFKRQVVLQILEWPEKIMEKSVQNLVGKREREGGDDETDDEPRGTKFWDFTFHLPGKVKKPSKRARYSSSTTACTEENIIIEAIQRMIQNSPLDERKANNLVEQLEIYKEDHEKSREMENKLEMLRHLKNVAESELEELRQSFNQQLAKAQKKPGHKIPNEVFRGPATFYFGFHFHYL